MTGVMTPVSCTNHSLSNQKWVRIEILLTHTKHRTSISSNRNYFRDPRMTNRELFLTCHDSQFTTRSLYDTFLQGRKTELEEFQLCLGSRLGRWRRVG
jgi:hypothetical protein